MPKIVPPKPPSQRQAALPSILQRILADRRRHVKAAQMRVTLTELKQRARERVPRDFLLALRRAHTRIAPAVIAELKQASPSKGRLREDFDVPALAASYEMAGAAAISVLTEEDHFLGQLEYLSLAHRATAVPVLRKDFIYCHYQVWEAAASGADAVLLIAAVLEDRQMRRLITQSRLARVAPVVEVHSRDEIARAVDLGADCIGVNNRDLNTFQVDSNRALELAEYIPRDVVGVAESGLRTPEDLVRARQAGYQAVLIGEHLMRSRDPGEALMQLLRGIPAAPVGHGFVKICGLTNLADARAACAAGADAVGFVFAPSPRRASPEQVRAITPELPVDVLRVGVFAGQSLAQVRQIALGCGLNAVQLHGAYAPADGQRLAESVPVWRVLSMPVDAGRALPWLGSSERFLLDTAVAGQSGGTGLSFDWDSARRLPPQIAPGQLVVAGGLRPSNVGEAIRRSGAGGVDVSSGVELAPGRKNHEAVASFIANARQAFVRRPVSEGRSA
ncbi:MAG: indole-3-glycerol phosphate synthase TrpC [Terriglobales bacterium]